MRATTMLPDLGMRQISASAGRRSIASLSRQGALPLLEATMSDDDADYIGLTHEHEEMLRAMASNADLSPIYREAVQRALAEIEILDGKAMRMPGRRCA